MWPSENANSAWKARQRDGTPMSQGAPQSYLDRHAHSSHFCSASLPIQGEAACHTIQVARQQVTPVVAGTSLLLIKMSFLCDSTVQLSLPTVYEPNELFCFRLTKGWREDFWV